MMSSDGVKSETGEIFTFLCFLFVFPRFLAWSAVFLLCFMNENRVDLKRVYHYEL